MKLAGRTDGWIDTIADRVFAVRAGIEEEGSGNVPSPPGATPYAILILDRGFVPPRDT